MFDKKYLDTYVDVHPPALTKRQVSFLIKNLRLKKTQEILDLACGFGRHAIPLAKAGYKITGVDYSKYLLARAKIEAKKAGARVKFARKDMRSLGFKNKFDVIYAMFTAFGYFADEKDNEKALKSMARSLKPGGKFLLDLNNIIEVITRVNKLHKKKSDGTMTKVFKEELSNDLKIKITSTFNHQKMTMAMKIEWRDESDKEKNFETKVRLYSLPEITNMLGEAGLKVEKIFGDFNGSEYKFSSPRMIILATKQ